MNQVKMKQGIITFLEGLGIDLSNQHFKDTPDRIVNAYIEIFAGMDNTEKLVKSILNAAFESKSDQMIIVKNIHVFSMCPHHFLPVEYYISVAYIPNGKVLGLSKLARLSETLAQRPIIQEDLTEEITKCLMTLDCQGAAARVEGLHFCMRMRGIKKPKSITVTSSVTGVFRDDPSVKSEFLSQLPESCF